MNTAEVKLPSAADLRSVEGLVQKTCTARGLEMAMKTSLKSYPGSAHWHFRKGNQPGTIEIIFWKDGRRLWIAVHSNRAGSWTAEEMRGLKSELQEKLGR